MLSGQPTGLSANITAATLTVRVNDAGLVSGLMTGTDAGADSPAGTYRISASGGVAPNYTFAYVDGILRVFVPGRDAVGFADDPVKIAGIDSRRQLWLGPFCACDRRLPLPGFYRMDSWCNL